MQQVSGTDMTAAAARGDWKPGVKHAVMKLKIVINFTSSTEAFAMNQQS